MKKTKGQGLPFAIFTACFISAAATLIFLSSAAHAAKVRVAGQYVAPDYVRYISQGYELDAVSRKKNLLFTITNGGLPVRIHLMTVDADKHTLDVLELPPDSFTVSDIYAGTLRDAYKNSSYREIIARTFCIVIDGSISLDSESFGGLAKLLGASDNYEYGKNLSEDYSCYTRGDVKAAGEYRRLFSEILEKIYEKGAAETFIDLMNLIANRADTDMSIEDLIDYLNELCKVKPKKANLRIARGSPAKFGDGVIWCLDPEENAEILNKHFRIKDVIYLPEALGIPKVEAGEYPFNELKERAADII